VILLAFEKGWALKPRTKNENPLTGGENVNTSDPNVGFDSRTMFVCAETKNGKTPFKLHTRARVEVINKQTRTL
jgi:hypothetical protein